jgi:hypothetical protein
MSREGSPSRPVVDEGGRSTTPAAGLRGSMDSLFSKASSSIQSAAQSAAQAVQDTAQSVARSPARRRPTREENATKKPPPFFKTAAQARRAGVFPSQPNTARTVNCKEFWEEPYDYTKGAKFIGPAINDGGAKPERKDQRGLYVRVRLKGGEPPADGFTSPPPPPLPTEVNKEGKQVPRTKFSEAEWAASQQELDERLEAMGFEPTYHARIRKAQREEAKHTTWEVDHGPRQAQWADYLRENPNPFKDRPDLFPTHLGRPRHDPLGGEPSMFEHLFKNKDGTDKRPFTIVHEDEFQRIVEQNAREEENWEPKEPEPGWEVTDHPSVAEEARIAAEDAQAALDGRKLEFGNNPCGNLRVDLHAIDATPARWRDDDGASTAASSPRNDLVKNHRHPIHCLIYAQATTSGNQARSTPSSSGPRSNSTPTKRRVVRI